MLLTFHSTIHWKLNKKDIRKRLAEAVFEASQELMREAKFWNVVIGEKEYMGGGGDMR